MITQAIMGIWIVLGLFAYGAIMGLAIRAIFTARDWVERLVAGGLIALVALITVTLLAASGVIA